MYFDFGELVIKDFDVAMIDEEYVSWLNDKDVVKYSEQRHKMHSIGSCIKYHDDMLRSDNPFLSISWGKQAKEHIGNISVYFDHPNNIAEMSIMIGNKKFWGKGIGLKSWCIVQDVLFQKFCVRRVVAGAMSINTPMVKIFDKAGMAVDCVRPKMFLHAGVEIDLVQVSKTRTNVI